MLDKTFPLTSLSEIIFSREYDRPDGNERPQRTTRGSPDGERAQWQARREWYGAIAALERLLDERVTEIEPPTTQGLILSGPAPAIGRPTLTPYFQTGLFALDAVPSAARSRSLPGTEVDTYASPCCEFPLLPGDPLEQEQFCLVLSATFSLLLVLGRDRAGVPRFSYTFAPEEIRDTWEALRTRIAIAAPERLREIEILAEAFPPVEPDYRTVMNFGRDLLSQLPDALPAPGGRPAEGTAARSLEAELLHAIAHEVRTPLTTIRTLIRLLLKRRNLEADIAKRLDTVDRECTEQINRMELIFWAAELERKKRQQPQVSLTPIPLEQVFEQSIPNWQKKARQRNVTLQVVVPDRLPTVVSDPSRLDRVLTGLMENFTSGQPTGGKVQVQVSTVGHLLKLQLLARAPQPSQSCSSPFTRTSQPSAPKSLGQLLSIRPETGSLCLNLQVTKNLFEALGGKLIVRQRSPGGEVLTVFLPLGTRSAKDTPLPTQRSDARTSLT